MPNGHSARAQKSSSNGHIDAAHKVEIRFHFLNQLFRLPSCFMSTTTNHDNSRERCGQAGKVILKLGIEAAIRRATRLVGEHLSMLPSLILLFDDIVSLKSLTMYLTATLDRHR